MRLPAASVRAEASGRECVDRGLQHAQRGSAVDPIMNLSTACAAWRPSRIAQTTSDWPRRIVSAGVLNAMRKLPQLADVASDLLANAPQLKITINRDQASRFGISPQLIDDTLNDAFGQRQITQYYTQLKIYFVILEILPELQRDLDALNRLYVKSPLTGGAVPLSALVDIDSSDCISLRHGAPRLWQDHANNLRR
jgi:hypothetical protein